MTNIPENALRARELYEQGQLTRDITAETGRGLSALYFWLAGGPKKSGVRALPPIVNGKLVTRRILKEGRLHLVERMMRAAERQMDQIEVRLAGSGQAPDASGRRAHAVLARTMQSLTALDAMHEKDAPKDGPKSKKPET